MGWVAKMCATGGEGSVAGESCDCAIHEGRWPCCDTLSPLLSFLQGSGMVDVAVVVHIKQNFILVDSQLTYEVIAFPGPADRALVVGT